MRSKLMLTVACCLLGLAFALSQVVSGQEEGGRRGFPEPQGQKDVTTTEIPGIIAAGEKWKLLWGGTDNADGLVPYKGGILFAQEQGDDIGRLDKNDKFSVFLKGTHHSGALAIDSKGEIWGVERTCTDPGGNPGACKEPTAVAILAPKYKVLADNIDGQSLGRLNDIVIDDKGGAYFNGTGTYYVSPSGKVSSIGENLRSNGIMLSRDGKTFYATNGRTLVAFDVQPDGTCTNQQDFATLEAGGAGDGMEIDAAGNLYVSSGASGIQVFSPDGKYLGVIPTPRPVASLAFSGPGKKTLYAQGRGALNADGTEYKTPKGVRNDGKSIYKIAVLTHGFEGRVK